MNFTDHRVRLYLASAPREKLRRMRTLEPSRFNDRIDEIGQGVQLATPRPESKLRRILRRFFEG